MIPNILGGRNTLHGFKPAFQAPVRARFGPPGARRAAADPPPRTARPANRRDRRRGRRHGRRRSSARTVGAGAGTPPGRGHGGRRRRRRPSARGPRTRCGCQGPAGCPSPRRERESGTAPGSPAPPRRSARSACRRDRGGPLRGGGGAGSGGDGRGRKPRYAAGAGVGRARARPGGCRCGRRGRAGRRRVGSECQVPRPPPIGRLWRAVLGAVAELGCRSAVDQRADLACRVGWRRMGIGS